MIRRRPAIRHLPAHPTPPARGAWPTKPFLSLLLLLLTIGGFAAPLEACPGCRDAGDPTAEAGTRTAQGYFWSILLMLGTLGCVGFGLTRLIHAAGKGEALIGTVRTTLPERIDDSP